MILTFELGVPVISLRATMVHIKSWKNMELMVYILEIDSLCNATMRII